MRRFIYVDAAISQRRATQRMPRAAGLGAVLIDRIPLAARADVVVVRDSSAAEYRAILLGMELAADLGVEWAEFRCDSRSVVDQIRGAARVRPNARADIQQLRKQVRRELGPRDWRVAYVAREANGWANTLAREALTTRDPRERLSTA